MHQNLRNKKQFIALVALLPICICAYAAIGQTPDSRGKNNPYSPSPNVRAKQETQQPTTVKTDNAETATAKVSRDMEIRPTVAQTTYKIATKAPSRSSAPTDIYKVGIGDVLFVNLKNTANASGYYTVRANGTIDLPLAGENVVVVGQTVGEIEDSLSVAITLYPNAQVEVKVRAFGSHKINVAGLAERSGEKSIQREAIPLYVVRADAVVDPRATKVFIRRADLSPVESYDLHDPKTDNILIYPGTVIEFIADGQNSVLTASGFYYIAGDVNTGGQKEFTSGLTLFQAILAAGGAKGNPKRAVIRRKNDNGSLNVAEHNLRAIKEGKAHDPVLSPGDMIEISN